MSKEKLVGLSQPKAMVHGFYVERFEYHLGRVMTLIETLGLSDVQGKAFKDLVKQEIWELWETAPFIEEKELLFGKTKPR